jgi:hypothetical protein
MRAMVVAAMLVMAGWMVQAADKPFAEKVKIDSGELQGAVQDGVLSKRRGPRSATTASSTRSQR